MPPEKWRQFFDTLSTELDGHDVTIEVLTEDYGDQYEVEKLPLAYFSYDDRDKEDVFIVAVGGQDRRYPELRHMIAHPKKILTDNAPPENPWVIEVESADGDRTLITVHEPLELPPGSK
jgi:hypothetical protein